MRTDSGLCFVDSDVLVYAFDRLEGEKHQKAARLIESLWQSRTGVLSTQVLEEFHNAITRSGGLGITLAVAAEILKAFSFWTVFTPRANDLIQAIALQEKFQLPFYDVLILQSALASKCGVIYSENLPKVNTIEGLKIINPFLG